ncbi:MAG TPA: hypothetical protein VN648_20315, partial [Candidatus Methylomirabilis sp.]|nr:hypothetical protein [Candidatus Methylomirabilis sp.]
MRLGGSRLGGLLSYAALGVAVVFALFPIVWTVLTSVKVPAEVLAYPPRWIPSQVTLIHYQDIFANSNMAR